FAPTAEMAERLRTVPGQLAQDSRRAALALQDLCEGPLRGMFDGPTTPGLDLDSKLVVLDLHAVKDSPAVGILMACATAWMSALLARMAERPGRERLINVADESWKIVQHTGLGEWFQSNFKLARQFGVMNLVVLHKLADLQAAGDAGSRRPPLPGGSRGGARAPPASPRGSSRTRRRASSTTRTRVRCRSPVRCWDCRAARRGSCRCCRRGRGRGGGGRARFACPPHAPRGRRRTGD